MPHIFPTTFSHFVVKVPPNSDRFLCSNILWHADSNLRVCLHMYQVREPPFCQQMRMRRQEMASMHVTHLMAIIKSSVRYLWQEKTITMPSNECDIKLFLQRNFGMGKIWHTHTPMRRLSDVRVCLSIRPHDVSSTREKLKTANDSSAPIWIAPSRMCFACVCIEFSVRDWSI